MQVIIIKWWIIKVLKTLYFCINSLETNQWNVHCFTPVIRATLKNSLKATVNQDIALTCLSNLCWRSASCINLDQNIVPQYSFEDLVVIFDNDFLTIFNKHWLAWNSRVDITQKRNTITTPSNLVAQMWKLILKYLSGSHFTRCHSHCETTTNMQN